jgi:mediator of RNA polymerase II transcription subunit 17
MAPAHNAPFTLRPKPAPGRKPKNLAEFIARVNTQAGGFRNLRQEDLLREADTQKDETVEDVEMADGQEEEGGETIKDIRGARDEILRNMECVAYIGNCTSVGLLC